MNAALARLKALLPKSSFARNVAVLAGGTAAGQAIVVLASPILTRLYTPEDFGVLAVYSSLLGILSTVAALRYELAIPLPEKDEDAAALVRLSLVIVIGMSLLVGFGVWNCIDIILKLFSIGSYIWLLPFGLFTVGMYQVFNYWAIRKCLFNHISRTKFNQSLAMISTQLILGLLIKNPFGLIIGNILGGTVGASTLSSSYRKIELKPSFFKIKHVAKKYIRFPLISSFSSLLNSGALQLPSLLIAWLYGSTAAGWFALVQKVMGLPMTLIGQAVAQVYFGEASHLMRIKDFHSLSKLYIKLTYRLLLITLFPALIIGLGGREIFGLIFGIQWETAGSYAQILVLMFVFQLISAPLSQTMNILNRQHWQLLWDGGRFTGIITTFLLAKTLKLTMYLTIVIYSSTMLAMYFLLWYLGLIALRNEMK